MAVKTREAGSCKSSAAKSVRSEKATGEDVVTVERRGGDRRKEVRAEATDPAAPTIERRVKKQRRRQIDPTTCERDYSNEEVEFMNAMDDYKRTSGRMFPTCSEVLEVIRGLGYVKLSATGAAMLVGELVEEEVCLAAGALV